MTDAITFEPFYGHAVSGERRFPRPDLEQALLDKLETGAGLRMFSLRRIGKSTLRLHAFQQLKQSGRPVAFIEGQETDSLSQLLHQIHAEFGEQSWMARALKLVGTAPAQAALKAALAGTGPDHQALSAYWQEITKRITQALSEQANSPVLIIDEFAFLLEKILRTDKARGANDAERLLASMRVWREHGLTMLLTGSIGIIRLLREHDITMDHLNGLQHLDVPELSEDTARKFIKAATATASAGRWTEAHIDKLIVEVGVFYPSFLVRSILELGRENPKPVEQFEDVFENTIRPDQHAEFFRQFDRRMKSYKSLPNDERQQIILPVLKNIMTSATAWDQADLTLRPPFEADELSLALDMLQEDGFITMVIKGDGRRLWRPASRLVRLWWTAARLK